MVLQTLDWIVVVSFLVLSLALGLAVSRRAGASTSEFFLAGRKMPWWLLGVSMVATTFSTDTPNLVTDIVRTQGVAGNWVWWAFLLTGMTTTFIYARLWRRSGVETDVGFYELRYSGRPARFLRGFRAIYLGAFFNVMILASVTLAAIKIGGRDDRRLAAHGGVGGRRRHRFLFDVRRPHRRLGDRFRAVPDRHGRLGYGRGVGGRAARGRRPRQAARRIPRWPSAFRSPPTSRIPTSLSRSS